MFRTCPQTGITLIALIITIIVMLILVGVTINVVLNGGLFTQAQTAASDTQIQADKEQLLSSVVGAIGIDGKVDFSKLVLPEGWTGSNGTYTSPKGNVFTVDENGNISSGSENGGTSEKDSQVPDELAKYILGQDLKGRKLLEEYDEDDNLIEGIMEENLIFKQDPTNSDSTIHEDLKFSHLLGETSSEDGAYCYIRYKRDVYKFEVDNTETTVKGSLEKVNTPEGNLGKYVTYKGITWIVLYDDENKVELISADTLGETTLGGSTFDTTKKSYNNAIETLTDACKEVTGITTGIRNVGGPVKDPEDLGTVTLAELKNEGFEPQSDKEAEIENLISDIKQVDENYLADYNQMKALAILRPDAPKDYWLSSRHLAGVESWNASFSVRFYSMEYNDISGRLWFLFAQLWFW